MNIVYGIACYHRPECKTLSTLANMGVKAEQIVIGVNCEEDNAEYGKRYGEDYRIVYSERHNVAGNRNSLLESIGGDVVLLDDDITMFKKYERNHGKYGRFVKCDLDEFEGMLRECFDKARAVGAPIFGFASLDNTMIAAQKHDMGHVYSLNGNFQGGFCGYVDRSVRHDENYDVLDDYELNLRMLAEGRSILRRNDWFASKGKMAGNVGGCKELYEGGAQHRCMAMLERQWGALFSRVKGDKGIRVTCATVEGLS